MEEFFFLNNFKLESCKAMLELCLETTNCKFTAIPYVKDLCETHAFVRAAKDVDDFRTRESYNYYAKHSPLVESFTLNEITLEECQKITTTCTTLEYCKFYKPSESTVLSKTFSEPTITYRVEYPDLDYNDYDIARLRSSEGDYNNKHTIFYGWFNTFAKAEEFAINKIEELHQSYKIIKEKNQIFIVNNEDPSEKVHWSVYDNKILIHGYYRYECNNYQKFSERYSISFGREPSYCTGYNEAFTETDIEMFIKWYNIRDLKYTIEFMPTIYRQADQFLHKDEAFTETNVEKFKKPDDVADFKYTNEDKPMMYRQAPQFFHKDGALQLPYGMVGVKEQLPPDYGNSFVFDGQHLAQFTISPTDYLHNGVFYIMGGDINVNTQGLNILNLSSNLKKIMFLAIYESTINLYGSINLYSKVPAELVFIATNQILCDGCNFPGVNKVTFCVMDEQEIKSSVYKFNDEGPDIFWNMSNDGGKLSQYCNGAGELREEEPGYDIKIGEQGLLSSGTYLNLLAGNIEIHGPTDTNDCYTHSKNVSKFYNNEDLQNKGYYNHIQKEFVDKRLYFPTYDYNPKFMA